jgi:general secretion pathway protein A
MSETYYGRFYGLDSPPFHITPDPALIFATETHQQALGTIEYGIASGKGFIVVTGEVGVGKTTVLKMCLDKLDSSKIKIIYIFNPALSIAELYEALLEGLDVPLQTDKRSVNPLHKLQRALLTAHKNGYQVILAVDEAQNMPEDTLETLRILSNFETAKSKLLQIILAGQPEFEATLAKHSLRQLAQRIAVRARIKPLTWRQSRAYIVHRIQCAGRPTNRPLFTIPALWYLALTARGIPRTINICCDNALINGYGAAAERISLKIARESCRSLQVRSPLRHLALFATVALAVVVFGIAVSGNAFLGHVLATPGGAAQASTVPDRHPERVNVAAEQFPPATTEAPNAAVAPDAQDIPRPAETVATDVSPEPASAAASEAPAADPATHQDPQAVWKWFVRKGDTVYKACRMTYGFCDEQALRTVYAYNPQLKPDAMIRQGEFIIMPQHIEPVRPN